jgi:hypothetical protein
LTGSCGSHCRLNKPRVRRSFPNECRGVSKGAGHFKSDFPTRNSGL